MHDIFTQFLLVYQRSMSSLSFLDLCPQKQCRRTQLQSKLHQTRCKHLSFSLGHTQKSDSWYEIYKQPSPWDILWGLHIFQKCLGRMFSNELEDKDIIQEGCSEFNELYYRYLLCYGFWQIDHQLHKKLFLKSYNITFISYQKQQTLTSVNPYLSQFKW